MFSRLLPERFDNAYRGHKAALWLFALLLLMKSAIGLNSMFNGYSVASSADGIPLETFSPGAAQTVVSMFALLGLSHFVFALIGLIALVRYRSMVPLMLALLLLEFLARRAALFLLPIPRTGTPPGFYVNVALAVLMTAGLALALWNRESRGAA